MNNAISADGAALPDDTRCRVAEFAADARHLIDAFEFCDMNDGVKNSDRKGRALENMRNGVENIATYFPTRTAAGAIFQLGLIWNACDSIHAEISVDKQKDSRLSGLNDAVRRMCESIMGFISTDEAVLRSGCADYYLGMEGHHSLVKAAAEQASREERVGK